MQDQPAPASPPPPAATADLHARTTSRVALASHSSKFSQVEREGTKRRKLFRIMLRANEASGDCDALWVLSNQGEMQLSPLKEGFSDSR
ncbi:hypothetical protein D9615_008457 [Tricholomella constricta]|uniref:Uncharacterized protein n=1 Tax=Tricholomella constricta TaxID=117010 RepID=A0A8H5H3R8_9AGAR|nr:hypothetical protein D9615_008457 [Tricholomella constricta]